MRVAILEPLMLQRNSNTVNSTHSTLNAQFYSNTLQRS